MENLGTSLEITVVGMLLVFGAIALLWGVMLVLVRLTDEHIPSLTATDEDEHERKRRAAAVAVAFALAKQETSEVHEFPLPATAIVSAWQAVMRANTLNQRRRL